MAKGARSNLDSLKTTERRGTGQAVNVDGVPATGNAPRLSDLIGADDLRVIEALASTGLLARIAANSWALRQLANGTAFEAIASWTNPGGVAGNPTLELDVQNSNLVLAGPASGSPAAPAFRALVAADLPNYAAGSFTPTLSFATPGDLSVAYATQTGEYLRIGRLVFVSILLTATPTYTTASGNLRIEGLPYTSDLLAYLTASVAEAITWPTSDTQIVGLVNSNDRAEIRSVGTASTQTAWTTAQAPSASARTFAMSGIFRVAA